ncbi:GIY-YIG nuclease family protein [Alteribacillus sp. HJP-4]|uniref:GIY-YIG nuclease family protein n=1 Tax=Alteribacillus sp. HJP-4 TaxID=2775394 RepID=UPI0035CCEA93
MEKTEHYVYVLECADGSYYTGYTNDIEKRLSVHESGKGAKYTRGRGPFKLIYQQGYTTKKEALQAEYMMKQLSRAAKKALISQVTIKGESGL